MIILIVFVYVVVCLGEGIPLYKNRKIKELWMVSILMISSFLISILLILGVQLPSPAEYIERILKPYIG